MSDIETLIVRTRSFEQEAHKILSVHETARSRVILLDATYRTLTNLSLKQDDLFRQALRCVENGLYRAAHVMAWSGFVDFFHEKLGSDHFVKLSAARPKWKIASVEDMRENYTDYAVIEASQASGLCTKSEKKALWGLLSRRNECGHPSNYYPGINETLGYISELIQRINAISIKPY